MKHRLPALIAHAILAGSTSLQFADDLQLRLDLRNSIPNDSASGGTWQLFAYKVETESGADGDYGIASTRALLNNIDINSIEFASGIGQPTTGGPFIQTLPTAQWRSTINNI